MVVEVAGDEVASEVGAVVVVVGVDEVADSEVVEAAAEDSAVAVVDSVGEVADSVVEVVAAVVSVVADKSIIDLKLNVYL